jgi:uncharacterized membrane protein YkvA (DUF1232 family)
MGQENPGGSEVGNSKVPAALKRWIDRLSYHPKKVYAQQYAEFCLNGRPKPRRPTAEWASRVEKKVEGALTAKGAKGRLAGPQVGPRTSEELSSDVRTRIDKLIAEDRTAATFAPATAQDLCAFLVSLDGVDGSGTKGKRVKEAWVRYTDELKKAARRPLEGEDAGDDGLVSIGTLRAAQDHRIAIYNRTCHYTSKVSRVVKAMSGGWAGIPKLASEYGSIEAFYQAHKADSTPPAKTATSEEGSQAGAVAPPKLSRDTRVVASGPVKGRRKAAGAKKRPSRTTPPPRTAHGKKVDGSGPARQRGNAAGRTTRKEIDSRVGASPPSLRVVAPNLALPREVRARIDEFIAKARGQMGEQEFLYIERHMARKVAVVSCSRVPWVSDLARQMDRLYQLYRTHTDGERTLDDEVLQLIGATLHYFVNPHDVIPDTTPGRGYLDDAYAHNRCLSELFKIAPQHVARASDAT